MLSEAVIMSIIAVASTALLGGLKIISHIRRSECAGTRCSTADTETVDPSSTPEPEPPAPTPEAPPIPVRAPPSPSAPPDPPQEAPELVISESESEA